MPGFSEASNTTRARTSNVKPAKGVVVFECQGKILGHGAVKCCVADIQVHEGSVSSEKVL